MKFRALKTLAIAGLISAPLSAFAVPTVFTGYDEGSNSLAGSPNAVAAAAAFDAAVSSASIIDFESVLPPAGVSITNGTRKNVPGCAASLCGYNTTSGGEYFLEAFGGQNFGGAITFTFDSAIDSFGAFFTGWQISSQTLTYADNSTVTLDMGVGGNGGTRFFGFVDSGAQILSVTYEAINDIVGIDDVRYGNASPVSEPGMLALFGLSLVGFGFASRKKSKS